MRGKTNWRKKDVRRIWKRIFFLCWRFTFNVIQSRKKFVPNGKERKRQKTTITKERKKEERKQEKKLEREKKHAGCPGGLEWLRVCCRRCHQS